MGIQPWLSPKTGMNAKDCNLKYTPNAHTASAKRLSTAFESMYITDPMEFMTTVGRPTRIMSIRMSFLILKPLVKNTSMSSCFFAFAFIMTTMGMSIATT